MIKKVSLARRVRYEQVQISIIIVVAPSAAHGASAIGHNAPGDNPGESAVAVVSVEDIIASKNADEQVEISIVVVISPGSANRVGNICRDSAGRHFGERPVAVVVIQEIPLTIIGNEEIKESVVVVVAPRTAFRTADLRDKDASNYLCECPIPIIMKKK